MNYTLTTTEDIKMNPAQAVNVTHATRSTQVGVANLLISGAHLTTEWEFISPELAREYQVLGIEKERKLRPNRVEALRADMESGRFFPIHVGIAFDTYGRRLDGQHRLQAIIESGCGQWMQVTRGIPVAWREVMDSGLMRSLPDASSDSWMNNLSVATGRRMMVGKNSQWDRAGISRARELEFLRAHREAICFAGMNHSSTVVKAGVRAAIAVAYYSVNRDLLAEFRDALIINNIDDAERRLLVSRFHHKLMNMGRLSSTEQSRSQYLLTQRVIKAFVDKEQLTRFSVPSDEVYTLPTITAI